MTYSPSAQDVCRIFFDTGKGFNESEVVRFNVNAGGGVMEYQLYATWPVEEAAY